ncbi:MAG: hypothetical protein LUH18_03750 [Oscillospiraceae bacterium]|nr:hypothetical protein [Oscillospiraceae bacterium]
MTDDERLNELMRCDGYEVDQVQMANFKRVLDWFIDLVAEGANRIESVELVPYKQDGVITVSLTGLDLKEDGVKRLCEIAGDVSSIVIRTSEGVDVWVTATVPDVFVKNN